jgi:hypothetical protein
MKYKVLIATMIAVVMVFSVFAMVPLNSGNQANSPAISGSAGAGFNNSIDTHFMHNNFGAKLTYNSTTGMVTGRYLIANYNSSTGVFSNVTYNMTSTVLISKMYSNGTTIAGFPIDLGFHNFFGNMAYRLGNLFIMVNGTSFYVLHNNPSLESNMMVRGNLTLDVPSTAHIYNTSSNTQVSISANASLNAQANVTALGNVNMTAQVMVNYNNTINVGRQMIVIDNNGTIAMLFIHNGNFKITNNTITISSTGFGPVLVNMVVPPGLQKVSNSSMVVSNILNGRISSEISLNKVNGTIVNSTVNYNSSTHFVYTGNSSSTTSFDINSTVNHHTIVTVFIGNNVTKNTGHAYVKFDGKIATYVSMSTLVNETSSTHAYYSYTNTSSGMYVFMYVPHFSNHTMVVSNTPFHNTDYTDYYIIGGLIAAIAIIGVGIYAIKKRK